MFGIKKYYSDPPYYVIDNISKIAFGLSSFSLLVKFYYNNPAIISILFILALLLLFVIFFFKSTFMVKVVTLALALTSVTLTIFRI